MIHGYAFVDIDVVSWLCFVKQRRERKEKEKGKGACWGVRIAQSFLLSWGLVGVMVFLWRGKYGDGGGSGGWVVD